MSGSHLSLYFLENCSVLISSSVAHFRSHLILPILKQLVGIQVSLENHACFLQLGPITMFLPLTAQYLLHLSHVAV